MLSPPPGPRDRSRTIPIPLPQKLSFPAVRDLVTVPTQGLAVRGV